MVSHKINCECQYIKLKTLLFLSWMSIRSQHVQSVSLLSIKEDVSKIVSKYEQKITNSLTYQNNLLCTQVEHMKSVVRANQDRLIKQKLQIDDLSDKIKTIQVRTQSKLLLLSKQLQNFKKYYDQCYQYTIKRINQVYDKLNLFSNQVQNEFKNCGMGPAVQYIRYTNELLVNIVKNSSLKTSDLKYYLDQELFQLEVQIGKFVQHFQDIDKIVDQLKTAQYGNDSLREAILAANKIIEGSKQSQAEMSNSQVGRKMVGYYEPKFKEIIKKINSYSMEIELVKSMINCENKQTRVKNQLKQKQFVQLQQKLDQLEKLVEDEKKNYQKNLAKKQQILKKRHDRILELEESMQKLLQKQMVLQHQISQLKLHNLQFSKQIKKQKIKDTINVQIQTQSKSTKSSSSKVERQKKELQNQQQKLLLLQIQYQNLLIKYDQQQNQLNGLKKQKEKAKHSKDSLDTRLAKSQRIRSQDDDFQMVFSPRIEKSKSKSKSKPKQSRNSRSCVGEISPLDTKSTVKINKYNDKSQNKLVAQNQRLMAINQQLSKTNKTLQIQIMNLLNEKSRQNQQDQQYLDQIQAELEKNNIEIQRLMADIVRLSQKNNDLQAQNDKLLDEITLLSQNFELKSNNYKSLVNKLEKQYQILFLKNKQLSTRLSSYEQLSGSEYDQKNHLFFENTFSQSLKNIYNCSSVSKDSKSSKTKEKRSKKQTQFIAQLQHAILGMGLPIPIICQIDSNGYIRQQKTGTYLVDQFKNPLILTEGELNAAIQDGLILM